MTQLAAERSAPKKKWKFKNFTGTATKLWKGARACLQIGTGKVVEATSAPGLFPIGRIHRTVDCSAADAPVEVELDREIELEYFVNATSTDAVASTDVGKLAYMMDDQTVTITPTGRSPIGRIWDVSTTDGVGIETLKFGRPFNEEQAAGAFTAADWAPTTLAHEGVYAVPTSAANSTITLPTAAPDGTRATFVANGTANGHTVQYRDESGLTNLTTALTASKKHMVIVQKTAGKWYANAYVSP